MRHCPFPSRKIVTLTRKTWAGGLWPIWVAIGMPVLLIALCATPIGPDFLFVLLGIPFLLCVWTCLGIWALVVSIRRIMRREWLRALTSATLPLAVLIAGMQFWGFVHLCNYGGDVVFFLARRPSYIADIRALPRDGNPRLLVFNRGGTSWASRGYVYDESDEVVLPQSLQSASWKMRADKTELTCGYFAQPLPGHLLFTKHWYIASFAC